MNLIWMIWEFASFWVLQSLPLEVGPDVPNVRRKISGRPKWSVTQWVWGAQGARFMRILSNHRGYSVNSRLHPDPEKKICRSWRLKIPILALGLIMDPIDIDQLSWGCIWFFLGEDIVEWWWHLWDFRVYLIGMVGLQHMGQHSTNGVGKFGHNLGELL